ncbi:hypothetical protein KJ695_04140 [Patescibacteria group bacterium]|nr:hypothetical protein [Patescibacteria group bacterium]MBU4057070.1 hypothetical protein [Patescibacteria group bacterium]MBU4368778.1 hypothetical protein [Patescibacteria group bacterium]
MSFLNFFRKTKYKEKSGKFSDFFLHTSDNEKKEVLKEAAHKANEEQRELFIKSRLKAKVN